MILMIWPPPWKCKIRNDNVNKVLYVLQTISKGISAKVSELYLYERDLEEVMKYVIIRFLF